MSRWDGLRAYQADPLRARNITFEPLLTGQLIMRFPRVPRINRELVMQHGAQWSRAWGGYLVPMQSVAAMRERVPVWDREIATDRARRLAAAA